MIPTPLLRALQSLILAMEAEAAWGPEPVPERTRESVAKESARRDRDVASHEKVSDDTSEARELFENELTVAVHGLR